MDQALQYPAYGRFTSNARARRTRTSVGNLLNFGACQYPSPLGIYRDECRPTRSSRSQDSDSHRGEPATKQPTDARRDAGGRQVLESNRTLLGDLTPLVDSSYLSRDEPRSYISSGRK